MEKIRLEKIRFEKIKLIIVDDHKIFLDGMKSLLSEIENIEIIATATSGEQLLELLKVTETDIVMTDITMKGMSGIDLTKTIKKDYKTVKVLILSMHTNEEFVLNSAKAGADGYLPKDTSIEELKEAINSIYNGEQYFSKDISEYFFKNYINRMKYEQNLIENEELTQREIEILKLAATGLTNKEIASKLFISVKTVDVHKNHIMQKLKLKNSAELVLFAVKNKVIDI